MQSTDTKSDLAFLYREENKSFTHSDRVSVVIVTFNKYNYVLFSPGGESFDSYKNYLDRGKHFNKLITKVIP